MRAIASAWASLSARRRVLPRSPTTGDYNWGGAYGTFFWVDPKEEMAVVYMVAAPGEGRGRLRTLVRNMVLQSIAD